MLSAIVLAAGLSSRMGTVNKLLLPFHNNTVIAIILEAILNSGIEDVIVVTGHEADQVEDALKNFNVRFTYNPRYREGMTSSIQQGVRAARGNGYMICLSDMVMITGDEYQMLEQAFENRLLADDKCICLPHYKNEKGNPVIFSAWYEQEILDNQQAVGCKNIVQANATHLHLVEMNTPHILYDFDYPDDYKKLASLS